MFERLKQESHRCRLEGALAALPRRHTALLLFAVVLLLPYPTTVVPEWRIRVVGADGNPVAGEPVRETWQHYSYESESHEEELSTDENGYVTFRERKIWMPPLVRIVLTPLAALMTLAHGSMGESAWVMTLKHSTYRPEFVYRRGRPLPVEYKLED